jgi:hypothetical protein
VRCGYRVWYRVAGEFRSGPGRAAGRPVVRGRVPGGLVRVGVPDAPRGGSMQALVSEVRVRVSGRASGRLPWNGQVAFGQGSKRQQQVAGRRAPTSAKCRWGLPCSYPVATTYFRKGHAPSRRRCSFPAPHESRGLEAPYARPRGPVCPLVVAICQVQYPGLPCSYPVAPSSHRRNAATTRPTDTIRIPAGSCDCWLSNELLAEAFGSGTNEIFTKMSWYEI